MVMKLSPEQQQLAASHLRLAKAVCRRLARGNRRHADDIFSAAMLGLCMAAAQYPGHGRFSTYAHVAITNHVLKAMRTIKRRCPPTAPLHQADRQTPPDTSLDDRVERDAILAMLPDRHATALRLVCLEGLDQPAAARAIGCSKQHVSRLIGQSRNLLAR